MKYIKHFICLLILFIMFLSCNKELIDFEDIKYPIIIDTMINKIQLSNLKLSSMTFYDKPYDTSVNVYRYFYTYDSLGRIKTTNTYENSKYNILYSDDSIIVKSTSLNEDTRIGYLDSNRIVRMNTWDIKFEYDTLNRLIRKFNQHDSIIYSYLDNNVIKRVEYVIEPFFESVTTSEYEYYDSIEIKDHQFFFRPYFNFYRINAGQIFVFQYLDFLGKLNTKLVKNLRINYDNGLEENYYYKWEINSNRITGLKIYSDTTFISQYKYYY